MVGQEVKRKRSFFSFMIYFIVKIKEDDVFALGAQLAYYLVLAFFPLLIFIMTLIGFSSLDSMQVIEGLNAILPSNVVDLTSSIIIEVVEHQSGSILGVSAVLTVWSASSAFRAVIKGVNKAYNIKENRSFVNRAIMAIICTFALGFIVMLTLGLLVFGQVIGDLLIKYVPYENILNKLWGATRYCIVIVIMIMIFAAIYRYTPSKRTEWREALPGAIVTTLGWITVSLIFSFYINNFANYSRIYGSLGAVFVLMTWLYISSIIIILGGEVNSVLVIRKNNLRIR